MPAQHDQQTETNAEKSVGRDNFAKETRQKYGMYPVTLVHTQYFSNRDGEEKNKSYHFYLELILFFLIIFLTCSLKDSSCFRALRSSSCCLSATSASCFSQTSFSSIFMANSISCLIPICASSSFSTS